jgi:hypothetical protein
LALAAKVANISIMPMKGMHQGQHHQEEGNRNQGGEHTGQE